MTTLACAQAATHPYFYTGLNYGSEAEFNPMNVILNDGYDILQVPGVDRHIFRFNYGGAFGNVFRAITDPWPSIKKDGVRTFLTEEIFPLSMPPVGGQWFPNYTQHLIGGGMVFARLREWYTQHGSSSPFWMTIGTVEVARWLNETMENGTWRGPGTDPIADLMVFDIAGPILYSHEGVRRFFSEQLNLTSWEGQPSVSLSGHELENSNTSYSLKARVPYTAHWLLFYYMGENPLGGLSYRTDGRDAFSLSVGGAVASLNVINATTNLKAVTLKRSAGFFWDRNNSLMASVVYGAAGNRLLVNLYPGVVRASSWQPGLWARLPSAGPLQVGLASRWTPGIATR